ncbi:MAG: hypothetical protein ACJ8FY_11590 [Gemmataceae bacterium]
MINFLGAACGSVRDRRTVLFAAALYSLFLCPMHLGAAPTDSPTRSGSSSVSSTFLRPTLGPSSPALIAGSWSWNQIFSPIRSILGNRARMIQFGAIGCCLALYIIWWRK